MFFHKYFRCKNYTFVTTKILNIVRGNIFIVLINVNYLKQLIKKVTEINNKKTALIY